MGEIPTTAMWLCALIWAHFYFDYAGQGDFVARAKNRTAPIPGVPWYQPLGAHAFIQGGGVGFIMQVAFGLWWIGIAETVAHFLIDDAKCRGRISYNADQALHIGCKVAWLAIAVSIT